jgi:hypothetical protein
MDGLIIGDILEWFLELKQRIRIILTVLVLKTSNILWSGWLNSRHSASLLVDLHEIFYFIGQSVDNDIEDDLWWLGQTQGDACKHVEGRAHFVALFAAHSWLELAVEQEEDEGPISSQVVWPRLETQISYLALIWVWILNVGLFMTQIELFMQSIEQKRKEFLRILLVEALELLTDVWYDQLEVSGNHVFVLPHSIQLFNALMNLNYKLSEGLS